MTKLPAPQKGLLYQKDRRSYRVIKPLKDSKTVNMTGNNSNLSSQKFMVKQLDPDKPKETSKVRPASAYVYGAGKKGPNPALIRM